MHLLARADSHLIVWQNDSGHTSGYGILLQYKSPSSELHHFETTGTHTCTHRSRKCDKFILESIPVQLKEHWQWMVQVQQ